jgi:methionine aminotransferase
MPEFPNVIKSKLPSVGTTIFTIMSSLANEHKAINLSQGFPDFETAPELISLVNHYMQKGMNQYAPMQGILSLREALAEKTLELYDVEYKPDTEITVTSGGTQAIYTAVTAMIREGDEVLVFEPAYDSYIPAIELAGGIPVYISLQAPDYKPDWNIVKKAITPKTRMIMLNTPHNPTGTVWTPEDMLELERIVSGTDISIISDEVYEHIIFDGIRHESVMRYPRLAERSFVVFSFGKTYHSTGWKMGYCLAPANLMTEFRKVHQFVVFCSNAPIQYALADYIRNKNYLELPSFYQEKRDYFLKLIAGSPFEYTPAKGSYFQCLSYKKFNRERDTEFAIRLTKEAGVASIPVSVFYHDKIDERILRFCFAKKNETLEKAAEKICSVGKLVNK